MLKDEHFQKRGEQGTLLSFGPDDEACKWAKLAICMQNTGAVLQNHEKIHLPSFPLKNASPFIYLSCPRIY